MTLVITGIKEHWFKLSFFILLGITVLSLSPLDELPDVPGADKTHHLIAYAVLSLPVALRRPNRWMFVITFFILYGGLIELIQPYVNRSGEWLDLLANTCGVLCGIMLAFLINKFFNSNH